MIIMIQQKLNSCSRSGFWQNFNSSSSLAPMINSVQK